MRDLDTQITRALFERGALTHAEVCRLLDVAPHSTEGARVRRRLHALHLRGVLTRVSAAGSVLWWVRV